MLRDWGGGGEGTLVTWTEINHIGEGLVGGHLELE